MTNSLPNLRRITLAANTDADPQYIALKLILASDEVKYSKRLSMVGKTCLQTSAKGFLRWLGHDYEAIGTKSYPAHYDEKSRQIIIRLEM